GGPERLPETAPLQPRPGFHYAAHKAGVERWLERFKPEARLRIVRLRPPAILGAHAHPLLRTLLRQPFYPHLPGPPPRLQCVWEEDVALAVQAALAREVRGAFNLAAEPPLPFRALHRRSRRWALPVPLPLLRATLAAAGRAGLAAGDTAWVEGLRHGLVLDTGRARAELGWTPRLDTAGCVDATLSGAAPLDRAPGP
ncbi:MAG: NAD-dependent dehydratase, partial [Gammaproteobacteria bacterium]|nr:NAD-dependent dehydratase [Gammaproteobacteria bacterium]